MPATEKQVNYFKALKEDLGEPADEQSVGEFVSKDVPQASVAITGLKARLDAKRTGTQGDEGVVESAEEAA